ncbi:hypothetical protein CR513_25187, partial [Mucuna pruriens]
MHHFSLKNASFLIVVMFYSSRLFFNLAKISFLHKFLFIQSFEDNSYHKINTCREAKGVSIVSDSWTDIQRISLINFMLTSERDPIFFKAIDASNEIINKHYMTNKMT